VARPPALGHGGTPALAPAQHAIAEADAAAPRLARGEALLAAITARAWSEVDDLASTLAGDDGSHAAGAQIANEFAQLSGLETFFRTYGRLPPEIKARINYLGTRRLYPCKIPLGHQAATAVASRLGAKLAARGTAAEAAETLEAFSPLADGHPLWLGTEPVDGRRRWTDGSTASLPDASPDTGSSLLLYPTGKSQGTLAWETAPMSQRHYFVMEWQEPGLPSPPPAPQMVRAKCLTYHKFCRDNDADTSLECAHAG